MWNKSSKHKSKKLTRSKPRRVKKSKAKKSKFGMLSRLRREIEKSRRPRTAHPSSLSTKKGPVRVFMSKPPGIELLIPKRALSELIRKSTKRTSRRRRVNTR